MGLGRSVLGTSHDAASCRAPRARSWSSVSTARPASAQAATPRCDRRLQSQDRRAWTQSYVPVQVFGLRAPSQVRAQARFTIDTLRASTFGHGGDGRRVDLVAGFGSAGPGDGLVAGDGLEKAEGHLGPAGVVGAEEQHSGLAVVVKSFDFGERFQLLAAEAFCDEGKERGDGGVVGELVVGGEQEPFDGLGAVNALELVAKPGCGGAQGQLGVDGRLAQVGAAVMMPFRCRGRGRSGGRPGGRCRRRRSRRRRRCRGVQGLGSPSAASTAPG